MAPDVVGKRLELLKEVVPKVSRVAVLQHPDNPASAPMLREVEARARALGVRLQILGVRNPAEIDSAFAAMTREAGGRSPEPLGRHLRQSAKTDPRARGEETPASDLWDPSVCGGRRARGLWRRLS
jgi:hypothetical protein